MEVSRAGCFCAQKAQLRHKFLVTFVVPDAKCINEFKIFVKRTLKFILVFTTVKTTVVFTCLVPEV